MLSTLQKKYNIDLSQLNANANANANANLTANVTLTLNTLKFISSSTYIVTLHLNLPKTYLYLCKVKGLNKCFYYPVINTGHRFSDALFQSEVLFSGYIYKNIFYIDDILVHNGEKVSEPIDKRIAIVNNIIDYHYVHDPVLSSVEIKTKEYVDYDYVSDFYLNYAQKLPYFQHIKGLHFCNLNFSTLTQGEENLNFIIEHDKIIHLNFLNGNLNESLKRHVIVHSPRVKECTFHVKKTDKPDVYELYLYDQTNSKLKYYDIACILTKEISIKVSKQMKFDNQTMKCEFNSDFSRWVPLYTVSSAADNIKLLLSES